MFLTHKVLELAKSHNGIVTSAMITELKISRGIIQYLVQQGKLEKSGRGVYALPGSFDDDYVNLQNRFKKSIFSLDTSLYLLGLSDRTPLKLTVALPLSYGLTSLRNEGVECYNDRFYGIGADILKTPYGNKIKAYGLERTICDLLLHKNKVDIQIFSDALKMYFSGEKNIPLLVKTARTLGVEKLLYLYTEVLM